MSKYQLAVENTIEIPINVDIRSGRVRKNFYFHVTAQRMSVEDWNVHFGPAAENPNRLVSDFLREHISGWRGQQLVLDEFGKSVEFDAEAFDLMLTVPGIDMLIFAGYQKAIFANDGDAGRRKNSAS